MVTGAEPLLEQGKEGFVLPAPPSRYCHFAEELYKWAEQLCARAEGERSAIAVKTAKLYLVEKYMDWRLAAPANHRNRLSTRNHICLFSVFTETYERLQKIELSLPLSPLVLPQPPQSANTPTIAGIFIGEAE